MVIVQIAHAHREREREREREAETQTALTTLTTPTGRLRRVAVVRSKRERPMTQCTRENVGHNCRQRRRAVKISTVTKEQGDRRCRYDVSDKDRQAKVTDRT